MKAVILATDQFEDMEVFFPSFRLLEEGIEVHIAAPNKEMIHGEHGYSLNPDKKIDAINPDDCDILIIPGGAPHGAPASVHKHPKAVEITRAFLAKNKTRCIYLLQALYPCFSKRG